MDQLAREYANQPVVFLEYDTDTYEGNRKDRWYAANEWTGGYLPYAMVNSGQSTAAGNSVSPISTSSYYALYKEMVDAELNQPPKATLEAHGRREGDRILVTVWLTNLTDVPLSYANSAEIYFIAVESNRITLTERFVRDSDSARIVDLAPGETTAFNFESRPMPNVDWSKMSSLILADYQPDSETDRFDTLQATAVEPSHFEAGPSELTLLVDPGHGTSGSATVQMRGAQLHWTVNETVPWLEAVPSSGTLPDLPQLVTVPGALTEGWQQGTIQLTATGSNNSSNSATLNVRVYYGPVYRQYLPITPW